MDSQGSAARLRAEAARRRRFTVRSLRRRIGGLEWLEPRLALTAETEPNNTLGTANGFTGSSGTLTGRIDNQVDVDYFSTALEAGQTLSLRYTENDSDGTPAFLPTMEILSPGGEVKAASMDAHSFSYTPGIAGTYGVRLTSQSTYGNITGDYDITYTLTAFTGVTESESNNTQGTANSLSTQANFRGSLASSSDADFFSFTVSAGQAVAVKFAEKPTLNPAVRLYAPGGTLLATDRSGVGLAASISTTGTYAIAIQSDNTAGTVTGSYSGQVLIATSPVLDGETGDLFESSTTLNLGPYVVPGIYL
ncbi:MAG TPA: hypothetical protein PLV92_18960, partial [Pirellulaceae bacterium]|nr:hypothetical protein [Pirellulaceae bacterium]